MEELLSPLEADIKAIIRVKDDNRKDRDWFTHLSTIAEGAPCIGWVAAVSYSIECIYGFQSNYPIAKPKPGPFVNEIKESSLFYGNRVIKEFKEK